jgi:hypothetical protein
MATDDEQEKETFARDLAKGALGGREGAQAIEDAVTQTVVDLITIHARTVAVRNALLKENEQLRNQLAGNTRDLPEGTSLEDQHREVLRMINEVGKRAVDGTLKSFALFWGEGKQIVLHASVDPRPLIQVAQKIH